MLLFRWCLAGVTAATAAALTGCGGGGGLADVQGTVTVAGKPLSKGEIQFAPFKGPPANGQIVDGKITDVRTKGSSGVGIGDCAVAITAFVPATPPNTGQTSLIHEKYQAISTSGLKTEIKSGTNEVKFDLMPADPPPKPKPKDKTKK